MRDNDAQLGRPSIIYKNTKSNIEAITSPVDGMIAFATDTLLFGYYADSAWTWKNFTGSTNCIPKFSDADTLVDSIIHDNGSSVSVGVSGGAESFVGRVEVNGVAGNELPTYSDEFLDASNWTSVDWTGDWATGWIHANGPTTVLSHDHAAVAGVRYQITYTVTRTAGSFAIAFGGQSLASITASGAFGPTATSTAALTITPTADFVGTIIISIKSLTAISAPVILIRNSAGTVVSELRIGGSTDNNVFVGSECGKYNTTGFNNVGVGKLAMIENSTGYYNVAIGSRALMINTVGFYNVAVGGYSMYNNTTGSYNVAIGQYALYTNASGGQNVAVGRYALQLANATANVAIGYYALQSATGGYNVAVGHNAGQSITTGQNNTFIGRDAGKNASQKVDASNSTAIGYGAYTTASNQIVLGNTSVTSVVIHGSITLDDAGNLVLGTTTGTKIGTGTTQKLGFFNANPIVQPSGATQAALAAYATGSYGLDSDAHMQALYDLVVAMRTTLVNLGLMKGAA